MALLNIISSLRERENAYEFIEEDIVIESTFIQQTSKNENLWKAQLGMTEHYLIILRCTIDYLFHEENNRNNRKNDLNLLMNRVPMSHLRVKKHGKRKLEILFPDGNICYFKLLISPGCGKAWSRWRTLEQISDWNVLPLVPKSKLICLSELDAHTRRNLIKRNFNVCFISLEKYLELDGGSDTFASPSVANTSRSFITNDSAIESDLSQSTTEQKNHSPKPELKCNRDTLPDSETTDAASRSAGTMRKQIRRFGEGVGENCMFPLTFTYCDATAADGNAQLGKCVTEKTQGRSRIPQKGDEEDRSESKGGGGTTYATNKYEERKHSENYARNVFKATQFFTHVSLLVTPGGLRKSKSADSLSEIPMEPSDADCLKINLSLPDVKELALYRRHNRLSYAADPFPERPHSCSSINDILFWLPSGGGPEGRIYCNSLVCRKILAAKRKRSLTQKGLLHQDFLKCDDKFRVCRGMNGVCSKYPRQMISTRQTFLCEWEKKHLKTVGSPGVKVIKYSSTDSIEFSHEIETKRKELRAARNRSISSSTKAQKFYPRAMAHALQRIQQRMFCEIETSEIARFILKPHSVTEINSPLLCGYIFFFERLKNIVKAEIKEQKSIEDSVEIYCAFVQVAIDCFKRKDEQSAFAIIAGLSSVVASKSNSLLLHIVLQKDVVRYTLQLFSHCWKKTMRQENKQLPFFLDFVTFVVETIIKDSQKAEKVSDNAPLWDVCASLKKNFQKRNFNTQQGNVSAKLRSLEADLEKVIEIIEQCRKLYVFKDFLEPQRKDIAVEDFLLLKQFHL